jgi:hypothetical protein
MSHTGTTAPNGDPNSVPGATTAAAAMSTSVYVRQAKPSEIPALAAVYARAFARDPVMNWLGSVRTLVPADYHQRQHDRPHRPRRFFRRGRHDKAGDNQTETEGDARARRTVEALGHFQLMLVKMAQILGMIVVVVEKEESEEGGGGEEKSSREDRGRRVVVAAGLEHGPVAAHVYAHLAVEGAVELGARDAQGACPCVCSPQYLCVVWAFFHQVLTDVGGWRGCTNIFFPVQKSLFDYAPTVDKAFDETFAGRGLKPLDSWHLFEIAVEPTCEGKGAT